MGNGAAAARGEARGDEEQGGGANGWGRTRARERSEYGEGGVVNKLLKLFWSVLERCRPFLGLRPMHVSYNYSRRRRYSIV